MARTRLWSCSGCGAQLGVILYERRKPPALYPLPQVLCLTVRAGVVSFQCPQCRAVVEWRERRPTQPAA